MKRWLIAFTFVFGVDRAHAQEPRPHLELPQQSITDGEKVKFGPMSIPSSRAERDSRPLMIGAGIVVLVAAMWWTRRQRERFDRSDQPPSPRATTESREDADDLQAAARGDKDDEA